MPRRNELGDGRFCPAGRDFIAPRSTLPYCNSHSDNEGKALRTLSCSGSPAYTPDTNGATKLSRISAPNLRRMKSATDSSCCGGRLRRNSSAAACSRVPPLKNELVKKDCGDNGTRC